MQSYHRDALVVAIIATLGGAIIGAASSEAVAAMTEKDKAADWLSAVGTWVVGVVGVFLTWQVNRANSIQSKARDRSGRIEALAAYNQWMSKIIRLTTTSVVARDIQSRLSINATAAPMDISDSVRKVMATIDVGEISNSHFIKDVNNVELFANLSSHRDQLLAACDGFLNKHPHASGPAITWNSTAMSKLADIQTLATSTSAIATGVRTVAEHFRPPPVD